jgi:hypothetical protein
MEEVIMVINVIDSYLRKRPKDYRAKNCFHPSSLHKSARELYHHYLHGDNQVDFEPRIMRIFDNGHGVHSRLQHYLCEAGLLQQTEVPIANKEYEIQGHTDGIINIHGVTGILEIKSMNSNQFYSLYEPKFEHLIQVNIYMFCTVISRACLLYECKDNQNLKEFYIKQDPLILEPVLSKIKYVQSCIRDGIEPS